jgi:predicted aspartyl protease
METTEMSRVVTAARIESLEDLWAARPGLLAAADVRAVDVSNAMVDTGLMSLAVPTSLIQRLGLTQRGERPSVTSGGMHIAKKFDAVRLTIMGRDCTIDVVEVPDPVPVLIGQVPLELLDFVVDPKNQCLIGNPEHGGEQIIELYEIN